MERDLTSPAQVDPPGLRKSAESSASRSHPRRGAVPASSLRTSWRVTSPSNYNHVGMSGPGLFRPPPPSNEPVLDYAPGSPEREALKRGSPRCGRAARDPADHRRRGGPHRRHRRSGRCRTNTARAGRRPQGRRRRRSSRRSPPPARPGGTGSGAVGGARGGLPARRRAARRTVARRRSTPRRCSASRRRRYQAEIDAACELIDFWRFNVAVHAPDLRRAADLGARHVEPDRVPPARGLRLRGHAVQLHRDRAATCRPRRR